MTDTLDITTGEFTEDIDPSLPEKEREWQRLVNDGRDLRKMGELGKWGIGDKALEVAQKWDREKSLIAYGNEIGLSHPRNIYDYADMAEVFDQSARAYFYQYCPETRWSHWRDAARWAVRNKKTSDEAKAKVVEANDNHINTRDFADMLRDDPDGDYVTKRTYVPATLMNSTSDDGEATALFKIDPKDVQRIHDLKTQKGFRVVVSLIYQEKKI